MKWCYECRNVVAEVEALCLLSPNSMKIFNLTDLISECSLDSSRNRTNKSFKIKLSHHRPSESCSATSRSAGKAIVLTWEQLFRWNFLTGAFKKQTHCSVMGLNSEKQDCSQSEWWRVLVFIINAHHKNRKSDLQLWQWWFPLQMLTLKPQSGGQSVKTRPKLPISRKRPRAEPELKVRDHHNPHQPLAIPHSLLRDSMWGVYSVQRTPGSLQAQMEYLGRSSKHVPGS